MSTGGGHHRDSSIDHQGLAGDVAGVAGQARPGRGAAEGGGQNCMRCHNLRQPHERSDSEWEAIVFHMRVRENLTAEEHRLIVEFLKAAN